MAKLFVVSDIHSFYTPLMEALNEKGFDPNNDNHWLIVCGDAFDRGNESEEVFRFLMSLERKILIRGNHDILLEACCKRGFAHPYGYDDLNGTTRTINDIGGAGEGIPFSECCQKTWNKLAIYRELLVNYFETKNYIFFHSWIPITSKNKYDRNWRRATNKRWEDAMWGNPFQLAEQGLLPNKTLVFGHFHTSWARKTYEDKFFLPHFLQQVQFLKQ